MQEKSQVVTIFGGTGFIGRRVVHTLAKQGYTLCIPSRTIQSIQPLMSYGNTGQISGVACNINDVQSIENAIEESDIVINLVGILFEKGKSNFHEIHHLFPERLSIACKKLGIKKLVHISAIGADEKSTSLYQKSKRKGELSLLKGFPDATILRPSVVFGAEDNFINLFASLAKKMPCLPLIGGGKTLFQPVYVDDIAQAIEQVISREDTAGGIYECGGPEILSFKSILEFIMESINVKRLLISIPWVIAKFQGFFLEILPKPLLTRDQVESLKSDNIVGKDSLNFSDLGIQPQSLRLIAPHYLQKFRKNK